MKICRWPTCFPGLWKVVAETKEWAAERICKRRSVVSTRGRGREEGKATESGLLQSWGCACGIRIEEEYEM